MSHYNQRYAFVSSARLDVRAGSGPSPHLLGLMAALAKRGKKVALVGPPPLRLPLFLLGAWFNRRLAGTLSELEIDVAIGFAGDGYRFARSRRKSRFVSFLSEVAPDWASPYSHRRRCERVACKTGDLVVVTSEYARNRIVDAYALTQEQIAVVPCGVDPEEWKQRALPQHDRPRVLAVDDGAGPLNLEWLLGGFAWLRESGLDAELQLCTSNPGILSRHADLARRCGSPGLSVQSVGLRRSELKAEIGACDLFVQIGSRAGSAPHLLWAMATGRPVVAPEAVDFPEMVASGGLLVPPDDSPALGRALANALGSREQQSELAAKARRRADQLSWDAAAIRFGNLLSQV